MAYSPGTDGESWGYLDSDLRILETQVVAGDLEALKLAARIRNPISVAPYEELNQIIGRSIRPKPEVFLRWVSETNPNDKDLADILNNAGLQYVDRSNAREYELRERAKALRGVSVPGVEEAQARCVPLLEAEDGI